MNKYTLCVHGSDGAFDERTGAVSVPIYQSATFKHPGVGQSTGFDYSRMLNPTRLALEKAVAALEGGEFALAYSSGMAAAASLCEAFNPGDEILASDDLYGGMIRYFRQVSKKNGLTVRFLDLTDLDVLKNSLTANTKAVFIETPSNPMMKVTDIRAIADITHPLGIKLVVDNTFLTPYFQRPLELGADAVIHSGTKFLAGHNDTLAGFTVCNDRVFFDKLAFLYKTVGACLSPFDSWLVLRGLKTLGIRMEKQQQNAFKIADFLKSHSRVTKVIYSGLPDCDGYSIMKKQASGFGSMISFEVESKELAESILGSVKLIAFAESLGGVETLITYPTLQTHADVPLDERIARGINDRLLRLSVGIEDADDLISDLLQALNIVGSD